MRFIHLYLIAYFMLVIGAGLALWQAGIVRHVPPLWIAVAALVAIGPGLLLALISTRTHRLPAE
jgi:hypothetical protein